MDLSIPLGKWFGVPVALHFSWVLFIVLIAWQNPNFAIVLSSLFGIVLLHEFGHSLAGMYFNHKTRSITLYPFGGVALMEMPAKASQELVVALAGPAVNVLFVPILWLLVHLFPEYGILGQIYQSNLVLLVFNMLPSFPMDGGRVFRALMAMSLKDHSRATIIAARVGQAFCVGFGTLGILVSNPMLVVIGFFLYLNADKEIFEAQQEIFTREMHEMVTGTKTSPTANRDFAKSAKMLDEIQRRIASIDNRSNSE